MVKYLCVLIEMLCVLWNKIAKELFFFVEGEYKEEKRRHPCEQGASGGGVDTTHQGGKAKLVEGKG